MSKIVISDLSVLEELNWQKLSEVKGSAGAAAAAAYADRYGATGGAAAVVGNSTTLDILVATGYIPPGIYGTYISIK